MTTAWPIQLPLTLRPRRAAAPGTAEAWFIPGADPRIWLDEICRWGVATQPLRLLVVPRSRGDRRAAGVLVIAPAQLVGKIATSPLPEAYVRVGETIYIPATTVLHPPTSDAELREMLRLEVNLLHPSIGLIGCAADELLHVADLLQAPQASAVEWGLAVPGIAAEANLRSVRPSSVPTVDEFFEQSRDDIGSDNPNDLPKLPQETMFKAILSNVLIGGLSAMQWLSNHLGAAIGGGGVAGGTAGGAAGAFGNWLSEKLSALRKGLEEARGREMSRLMHLLRTNPDEGLRYALPLNAPNSGRGVGQPGARLGLRNIDFSLGGLFSSAPADPWQLSWEMHQKLMNTYRELASRELSLGRYRRAAYIFGQLLRDFHSAANALKQGRFYREAAALYRDQLQDKRAAAECLEEGGLLVEAIELYESLRQYEKVGDLHRTLDHVDEANRAYRLATAALRDAGDTLGAARLLESKLQAPDEALELLTQAWPDAKQASACLEESFALLGRLARHEESARRATHFRDTPQAPVRALPLADVLANVATSYPSFDVRAAAADATRVVVGHRLPSAPASEAFCLVNAAVRVTPDDRLLLRDGQRFADRVSKKTAVRPARPQRPQRPLGSSSAAKSPTLVRTFRLGGDTNWTAAISAGSTFFAFGVRADELVLLRGTWDGTMQHVTWPDPMAAESAYRLRFGDEHRLMIVPALGCDRRLSNKQFPAHDGFRAQLTAGTPYFFPPGTIYDASVDEASTTWLLHAQENETNLLLSAFSSPGGALRSSQRTAIPIPAGAGAVPSINLVVRAGHACVTCGSEVWAQESGNWRSIDLRSSIVDVTASPLHTRLRLAVCFPEGGCVVWPAGFELYRFAQQLVDPVCCILRDGTLVASGRHQTVLYSMDGHDLSHQATFDTDAAPPIAVLPALDSNHFATLTSEGLVKLFRRG
jgi:tetratricopeptide (TPR) repeat protein